MKKNTLKLSIILSVVLFSLYAAGCGKGDEYGVGPVKEVKLGSLDDGMVAKGKQIFDTKCVACHKFNSRLVGPPLKDVTKRRKPEWIMNQILNPVEMTQKNQVAKELFAQYMIQMTFQDVTHDDTRAILEYFRAVDDNKVTLKE